MTLDWTLLRQRNRRVWLAGCAMAFLSMLGSWTLPWHSTLDPGADPMGGYIASYVDTPNAVNAFHTLAWLLILPTVAVLVAYAALRPGPEAPPWLRLVPGVGIGVLGMCAAIWGLRAMSAADDLTEAYEYTETSFPGGVTFMLLAVVVLVVGLRRLRPTADAPSAPPVAPPSVPPATPPA